MSTSQTARHGLCCAALSFALLSAHPAAAWALSNPAWAAGVADKDSQGSQTEYAAPESPFLAMLPCDVQSCVGQMRSKDPSRSWRAVRRLRRMGPRAALAVPLLIDVLNKSGDRDAGNGHSPAEEACRLIVDMPPQTVDVLLRHAHELPAEGKSLVLFVLAAKREKRAIPIFLSALHDSDRNVRMEAADALAEMPQPKAVPELLKLLQEDDLSLALPALRALKASKDPRALDAFRRIAPDAGADESLREQAVGALAYLTPETETALFRRLARDEDVPDYVRAQAVIGLAKARDESAFELACDCMHSKYQGIVLAGLVALGEIGDDRSIEILCAVSDTPAPYIRGAVLRGTAARALIGGGVKHAVGRVREILRTSDPEQDYIVRVTLGDMLAASDRPEAFGTAMALLKGDDPHLRDEVVRFLATGTARVDVPDGFAPDHRFRRFPIHKDPGLVPVLQEIIVDEDVPSQVRAYAHWALRKTDDRRAIAFLEKLDAAENAAMDASDREGPECSPPGAEAKSNDQR